MYGVNKNNGKKLLDLQWQNTLSDYVTAVTWSPDGNILSASSAAGEVLLWKADGIIQLQEVTEKSVDCLAFSKDGQFLATAGQDGKVKIWRLPQIPPNSPLKREEKLTSPPFPTREGGSGGLGQLIATLENAPAWVDQLAWSPRANQLAFSIGRYVQIWDASEGEVVATLNFEASSVLGMSWRPDGEFLAIAGNKGAKVWNARDWDDDPFVVDMPAASLAIAWSPDGKYLASGNLDFSITVLEWDNPRFPWVMRGFPGKIRSLAWSQASSLFASSSVEGIVVWEKHPDESVGWESRVLDAHNGVVVAIAFCPGSLLLASAADDGWVCLWQKAQQIGQILPGAPGGFSCLAWNPQGHQLATGGQKGELLIWSKSTRAQGFKRR